MKIKKILPYAALILVACTPAWAWFGNLPQQDLTKRAKKVASVMGMGAIRAYELQWAWMSDREILIFHNENMINAGMKPSGSLRLTAVDVSSRKTRPLPLVQKRLANLHPELWGQDFTGLWISPNGRWSLWRTMWFHSPVYFFTISSAGVSASEWTESTAESYGSEVAWMPGSSRWVRLRYDQSGQGFTTIEFHNPTRQSDIRRAEFPAHGVHGKLLGFSEDGRILFCDSDDRRTAHFASVDINDKPQTNSYTCSTPDHAEIDDIALNVKGNRLAWLVQPIQILSGTPKWLVTVQRTIRYKRPQIGMEIWISDSKGQHMHQLGFAERGNRFPVGNGRVAWSPDGKRLAFSHNYSLYVMPVK